MSNLDPTTPNADEDIPAWDTSTQLLGGDKNAPLNRAPQALLNKLLGWVAKYASSAGASFVGFIHSGAGAVVETLQTLLRRIVWVEQFGADPTGATDSYAAFAAAFAAAKGRTVRAGAGTFVIAAQSVEYNDQTAAGSYRPGAKFVGDGIGKTIIINRCGALAFNSTPTQAQGDANPVSYARGTLFKGFTLTTDGSSAPGSEGIGITGQYFPNFEDVALLNLLGDAIRAPVDARWANPDRYSNGDVTVRRCVISGNTGWGINSPAFSNTWDIANNYITANAKGGLYLVGTGHHIRGNSIAGNGTPGDDSGGIVLARSTQGSSQIAVIFDNEIDTNYNRQLWLQSQNCTVFGNRFIDDATSGAFKSPNQIEVGGINGDTFDGNLVERNIFRQTAMSAANVTLMRVRLPVATGAQTARYNKLRDPLISTSGATTGVVTPFSVENSTSQWVEGNTYHYNGRLQYSSSVSGSTDRAFAIAYVATAQTPPTSAGSAATIPASVVVSDPNGDFDNAAYTFKARYTGLLEVKAIMDVVNGAANAPVSFVLQRDSGSGFADVSTAVCRDGNARTFCAPFELVVAGGDKVRVQFYQAAGGGAQVSSGMASRISFKMK